MSALTSVGIGLEFMIQNPISFVYLTLGVFFGMVFGAIPGLTASLAVTLILPFTYAMVAQNGLTTLIGIYVGGISGGLVSAILLNIPGTPSSLVTCFDGSPLARQGKAHDALSLGVFASLFGGVFSALALIIIAPQLAKIALLFGPWEYFAMGVMGLAVVVSLCSTDDLLKGLIGAIIGLLIGSVGMDSVSGVSRFTFGFWQLGAGLSNLATLMGLFALTEILTQLSTFNQKSTVLKSEKVRFFPDLKRLFFPNIKNYIRSSAIGTIIGILPGVGQSTACMIAYDQAKQASDHPENFGKGEHNGVIASEASNNAVCGGAIIPMLTMGIPGDTVTSILLGGLVVHGLQPGPLLFQTNQDIIGVVFVAYFLANFVMYAMFMKLMPFFIKVLTIPLKYMFPILLVMCSLGSFTVNNRVFDIWVLLIIGLLGYILINCGFSLPPIVLGYILASIIESNFRTALMGSRGNFADIFTRPIAMGLMIFATIMVIWPLYKMRKKKAAAAK